VVTVGLAVVADPAIAATVVAMFVVGAVGVVDDFAVLSWPTKLAAQMVVAALYVAVAHPLAGFGALAPAIGFVWLLITMNAVNFIDNSDGLASGTAALSAATLAVLAMVHGQPEVAAFAAAVAGAAAAFFLHNFPSGSVFLGDAGSLSLGFVLGALVMLVCGERGPDGVGHLAIPLGYPLIDLCFVIADRWRRGGSIVRGGTDHTVHQLGRRLRSLRLAVTLFLALSAVLGAAAIAIAVAVE
jgi:UDP-GlcNAc:undecaprenyl-phosphate GlcNAc-1-phosphate transferase